MSFGVHVIGSQCDTKTELVSANFLGRLRLAPATQALVQGRQPISPAQVVLTLGSFRGIVTYTGTELLGHGTYGKVFLAETTSSGWPRAVAVKVIEKEALGEVRAIAGTWRRSSRDIIAASVVWSSGGAAVVAMQVAMTSLEAYVAPSPLQAPKAANIVLAVAGAMRGLYESTGYVYWDLRATNVLLICSGSHIEAVLADYGGCAPLDAPVRAPFPPPDQIGEAFTANTVQNAIYQLVPLLLHIMGIDTTKLNAASSKRRASKYLEGLMEL